MTVVLKIQKGVSHRNPPGGESQMVCSQILIPTEKISSFFVPFPELRLGAKTVMYLVIS